MNTQINLKKLAPYAVAGAAIAAGITLWSEAQSGLPKGAIVVNNFEINSYLGQWYEIARFNYRFEKGLQNVTAHYSLNKNGTVKVINRGQEISTGRWRESTGKAKFAGEENIGMLKVSFFGPFYAAYNVIAIADDYQHALVAGKNLDYLWLLSRAPEMPDAVRNSFLQKAWAIGYDVGKLVWTQQQAADEMPIPTVS
ncbi:lipocalin family protein [Mucilaginibacter mali]|uniref:Outer membrane lipoprotein Blc n=1 Tax=Mucilaginibacter mali TaxID=2740462 RepID=A0A7D4QQB5_9SPHI|nr:lipocalin family protein [Mucilaginibacter mali]QKJ29009.1 lipocalin family protein [Mucilaginibacter mali]